MAVEGSGGARDAPPNGIVIWDNDTAEVDGVEAIPNRRCTPRNMNERISARALGLVTSPGAIEEYVDEHGRGEVDLPRYYSRFKEEFGEEDDKEIHRGPVTAEVGDDDVEEETGLEGVLVEAALRALDGGGRYNRDDYTLHDCLPMPCVLVGTDGAVLIVPTLRPLPDEGNE